jgi:hypothetical protein
VLCEICKQRGADALLMRRLKHDEFPFGEFPISRAHLNTLINSANSNEATNKGPNLENLACYLFLSFGSCMPMPNVKDIDDVSQHDLVVFNYGTNVGTFASRFGQHFLVECKNTVARADSAVVAYFLQRMMLTHSKFGVILSKYGVTGDGTGHKPERAEKYARALIRRAFHEHNITCLVLSLADIEELAQGKFPSVSSMLFQLANEFQFGK